MGNCKYAMDEEDIVAAESSDNKSSWAVAAILENATHQTLVLAHYRVNSEEEAIGKMVKECLEKRPEYAIVQILAGDINS